MSIDSAGTYEQGAIRVVELSPDDWQRLRDLKLQSLQEERVAFEEPEEGRDKYLSRSEKEWRDILSGKMSGGREGESLFSFAEADHRLIGMVSAIIPEKEIATVQHMYVAAEARGRGAGRILLENLLEKLKAKPNLKRIELAVIASQIPAVELYKSVGFKEKNRKVIARDGKSLEEIEMEIVLRQM